MTLLLLPLSLFWRALKGLLWLFNPFTEKESVNMRHAGYIWLVISGVSGGYYHQFFFSENALLFYMMFIIGASIVERGEKADEFTHEALAELLRRKQ